MLNRSYQHKLKQAKMGLKASLHIIGLVIGIHSLLKLTKLWVNYKIDKIGETSPPLPPISIPPSLPTLPDTCPAACSCPEGNAMPPDREYIPPPLLACAIPSVQNADVMKKIQSSCQPSRNYSPEKMEKLKKIEGIIRMMDADEVNCVSKDSGNGNPNTNTTYYSSNNGNMLFAQQANGERPMPPDLINDNGHKPS